MDWTKEEEKALCAGHDFVATTDVLSIATTAVEIVQARGGTMTAERIADLRESMAPLKQKHPAIAEEIGEALRHITAQGATVSTLQTKMAELEQDLQEEVARRERNEGALVEERDDARAEVERLKAELAEVSRQNQANLERANLREQEAGRRERMIKALTKERDKAEGEIELADDGRKRWKELAASAESRLAAVREMDIERACEVMHDAYEAAAKTEGWETQARSRKPWADVPEANKATMRAAVTALKDWVLEGNAPQEAKTCAWGDGECGNAAPAPCGFCNFHCGHARGICAGFGKRYPCSPTCTHDDAATPGHPERVKERSEAFNAAGICATEHCERHSAYDMGAEAMRAACLEAVRQRLQVDGSMDVYEIVKAAIEGAAP